MTLATPAAKAAMRSKLNKIRKAAGKRKPTAGTPIKGRISPTKPGL